MSVGGGGRIIGRSFLYTVVYLYLHMTTRGGCGVLRSDGRFFGQIAQSNVAAEKTLDG